MKDNIVSFSGGKDSSAMLLEMIELDYKIDDIIFVDTGLELPGMLEYIKKIEKYINRKITIIKPEHNWDYYFYSKKQKGKRKGEIYGWPYTIGAWCNDRLKMKPLRKYLSMFSDRIVFVGIAYDEPKRFEKLPKNTKAPLYEWKWTEKDAENYLKTKGLLNPLYEKFSRLGCYLCPKQNFKSLKVIFEEYPELWAKMKQYDKDSPVTFKPNKTLLEIEKKFKTSKS